METKAELILLLYLIFLSPASAMTLSEARMNTALVVSDLPPGAYVQFILNGGVPVFAVADEAGTAKYLPLSEGSLEIIVMQNSVVIYRVTVTVMPQVITNPPPQTPVLSTIIVSPQKAAVVAGNTLNFTASTLDQSGNPIAAVVTWNSSNMNAGTINNAGMFTAVSAGNTTITASGGAVSGTAAVTVVAINGTSRKGDCSGDGRVDITDALFIAQVTVGLRTFDPAQYAAADVSGDSKVDIVDALFIAQSTVGLRLL